MQVVREREDAVEIRHGQKLGSAVLNPLLFARGLTGGAVLVPAGVVERHLGPAGVTAIEMATQRGGAPGQDVSHGVELMRSDGLGAFVFGPVCPKHVRHPQVGRLHDQLLGRQSKELTTERRCSLVT